MLTKTKGTRPRSTKIMTGGHEIKIKTKTRSHETETKRGLRDQD